MKNMATAIRVLYNEMREEGEEVFAWYTFNTSTGSMFYGTYSHLKSLEINISKIQRKPGRSPTKTKKIR